jgi:carbonic anhydrase/acetyltransferase-like protein (isoleucine patch superfamily)
MLFSFMGRTPQIGQNSYVSETAQVIGDVTIGDNCYIGHGAIVHGKSIGGLSVIGMGAVLSIRSEVGMGAIIGEGSIVTMKQVIPPHVVALGNPARAIREVTADDTAFWEHARQLYIDLAKKYCEYGLQPVTADSAPLAGL